MEWLGNPLLYVFVSFFGPDCVQLSIAFPSFWTYWPVETLHEFIQSQFLKKKQRIVRPTLPTAPLFSTLIFAGFPNQSPLLTMIARSSLFFFYVDQSRSHEWPWLGSFSIDDGDSSEKVTFKMNSRFFKLFRVYSNSLKMWNVSEFPWSWFLGDRTHA